MNGSMDIPFQSGRVVVDVRSTMDRIHMSCKAVLEREVDADRAVIEIVRWVLDELMEYWTKVSSVADLGKEIYGIRVEVVDILPAGMHWRVKLVEPGL